MARAGVSVTSRSAELFNDAATLLAVRLTASSYYEIFLGVLGPAVAFLFPEATVTLSNSGAYGSGVVEVNLGSDQQMIAGIFMGAVVGFGVRVLQQVYIPIYWARPWQLSWKTAFDLQFKFEIDILKLLIELIQYLLGKGADQGYINQGTSKKLSGYLDSKLAQSFKFYSNSFGTLGPGVTSLSATPRYSIPFDVIKNTPGLGGLIALMKAVQGKIEMGPVIEISMPVKLGLDSFTVVGGQGPNSKQTYSDLKYVGDYTAVATGLPFTSNPTTFQTNVTYSSSWNVGIGMFFKLAILKFFSVQVTTATLDLVHLLGRQLGETQIHSNVATQFEGNCVLVAAMSLACISESLSNFDVPPNTVVGGIPFTGTISVDETWTDPDVAISLQITPSVDGFPTSVVLARNTRSASFTFKFPNVALVPGEANDSSAPISPSTTSPDQAYIIDASIPQAVQPACSALQVSAPVTVRNRILSLNRRSTSSGIGPLWNPVKGGSSITAGSDASIAAATIYVSFPVVPGETFDAGIPVTFSLYDERRELRRGSNVVLFGAGIDMVVLSPSAKVIYRFNPASNENTLLVWWKSAGPASGYSNLFYLVMDGGVTFGKTEYWLTVSNWS